MKSPESHTDTYWTEQVITFQRDIAELEAFLNNNQNAISAEGEDTSETMADVEIDLIQAKSALKEAKIELARIRQQEEIAKLLPQIERLKNQVEIHRRTDPQEARDLESSLEELLVKVEKLRKDPVVDDEVE